MCDVAVPHAYVPSLQIMQVNVVMYVLILCAAGAYPAVEEQHGCVEQEWPAGTHQA